MTLYILDLETKETLHVFFDVNVIPNKGDRITILDKVLQVVERELNYSFDSDVEGYACESIILGVKIIN